MCPMSSKPPEQSGKSASDSYLKNSYFQTHIQPLTMAEGGTLYSTCGPFSVSGLTKEMYGLRGCLAPFSAKFQFNLCAVFIELYQNIEQYGIKLPDTDIDDAFGSIHIYQQDDESIQLRAINLVCRSDEFHLRDRLSTLQSLDKRELATRYRGQLASLAPNSGITHRRTGLGLLDMARRVGGQFRFDLAPIDEDYQLLVLEAHFTENVSTPLATRTEKMKPFILKASSRSPDISLNPEQNKLRISGESYPENVTAFYTQLEQALQNYFASNPEKLGVEIALRYCISGSAHALLNILRALDKHAQKGCVIELNWQVFVDDDIGREFAQDIAEQAPNLFLSIGEITE